MRTILNRSNLFRSVVLAAAFMVAFGFSLHAADPPKEVSTAAEQGLSSFVSGDFPNNMFDFANWENPEIVFGFEVFTLDPDKQWADKALNLHSTVVPTGVWRFVIKANGKPAALITVVNCDGKWRTVGIGAHGLSDEISAVTKAWPEDEGYNFRFIRLFQAKADFMEIREGPNAIGFVPLKSARIALGWDTPVFDPNMLVSNSAVDKPLRLIFSKGDSLKRSKEVQQ
jgi:hypothetical protein